MNADALKAEGNEAFKAGHFSEAAQRFSEALAQDPTNATLLSNRSGALAAMGNYGPALADADQAIQLSPQWVKGYSRRGAALYGMGRMQEALDAYEAGLRIEPGSAQMAQAAADVRQRMAEMPAAPMGAGMAAPVSLSGAGPAASTSAASVAPTKASSSSFGGWAKGLAERSKALAEKTVLTAQQAAKEAQQKASAVRDDLQRSLEVNKEKAEQSKREADERRARDTAGRQGDESARGAAEAAAREAAARDAAAAAEAAARAAAEEVEAREVEEALRAVEAVEAAEAEAEAAKQAAVDSGEFAEGYRQVGNEAFKGGRYEEAIEAYTQAIDLDPSSHLLYSNRSGAFCAVGAYEMAFADAERCVSLNPGWTKGHARLASARHGLGLYLQAIESFEVALRETPGDQALLQGRRQASFALALEEPL